MVAPTVGALVLVPFPFSDLSQTKLRPAAVLAAAGHGDWLLYQMTSNPYGDRRAIPLTDNDLHVGRLRGTGYARPGKLFTANRDLIVSETGIVQAAPFARLVHAVIAVLNEGISQHRRELQR